MRFSSTRLTASSSFCPPTYCSWSLSCELSSFYPDFSSPKDNLPFLSAAVRLDYDPIPPAGSNNGKVLGAVFAGVNTLEAVAVLFDTDVSLAVAATAGCISVALGPSVPKTVKVRFPCSFG